LLIIIKLKKKNAYNKNYDLFFFCPVLTKKIYGHFIHMATIVGRDKVVGRDNKKLTELEIQI